MKIRSIQIRIPNTVTLITSGLFSLAATIAIASPLAIQAADVYDLAIATPQNTCAASQGAQGAGGSVAIDGGKLVFTHGGSAGAGISDYLVARFPETTLAVGDAITLNFTIAGAPAPSLAWQPQSLRFGLFYIGDADPRTTNDYGPATGFRADYGRRMEKTNHNNGLRQRLRSSQNLFANNSARPVSTPDPTAFGYTRTPSGTITGTLAIRQVSTDTLEVTTSLGKIYPAADLVKVSGPLTLNALGIFITKHADTDRPAYTFTRLNVTHTPASNNAAATIAPVEVNPANTFTWWDAGDLIAIREDLRRNPETSPVQQAYTRLLADARAAAAVPLHSIMDKTRTPPSGDKHDYYTVGIYLWPNPDTPDHLPWVNRDGRRNPEHRNPEWDADTYTITINTIQTLALSSFFTGNAAHASRAVEHINHWFINPATRMNPNLNHAQVWPGRHEGSGWGAIEGVVLIELLDYIQLLSGTPAWTPEIDAGLRAWFADLAAWFLQNPKGQHILSSHENHGAWSLAMTATFARYGNRVDLMRQAIDRAHEKIDVEFAPDGSLPHELKRTLSLNYSIYCLRAFSVIARNAALLAPSSPETLWTYTGPSGQSIRQAFAFLAPYLLQQKPWPYPQIHGTGVGRGHTVQLTMLAHRAYGDSVFIDIARHIATKVSAPDDPQTWLLAIPPRTGIALN
ncbi:Alginate lyase [Opitutaceae bacterium TAV1]|nr:Alginate lyase [Opitutaceae bacterium TAV1]